MRAVRHSSFGMPAEVAELVELPDVGAPAEDEVIVAGEIAPIHPADLLNMEGRYGIRRPELPAFCGTDGVGRVVALGAGVGHLRIGDRVPLLLTRYPTWRESIRAKAEGLFALPDGDAGQLAMLGANPITAWALLNDFVPMKAGDWIVQNAACSSVGRAVTTFARRLGLRLIGVVRRAEMVEELTALGADVVLVDGPDLPSRILEATGGHPPTLGIDAVGGEATRRLAGSLARRGTVVTYGLLSGMPCQADAADVIFREVSLRGFWLAPWIRRKNRDDIAAIYRNLARLIADGTISTPIAEVYPLGRIKQALAHAAQPGRAGKVLLHLQE